MKKFLLVLIAFVVFSSHDMYLKLDTYFLQPNTSTAIKLFNGTFDKSENVIDRSRMTDVSLVGNGSRSQLDTTQWSEKDNMTILSFQTGEPGTWVAGVSTRARNIEMTAEDFNGYLEHDGVLDMLEWRKENDALGKDAVEKYSKHVKTIFQVGDKKTDDWQTALGYPIEFVPLSSPYDTHVGHDLKVNLLWQGKPLANQLVTIDSKGAAHGHSHEHEHTADAGHEHSDGHEHADEHDHADGADHDHEEDHEHTDGAGHDHDDDHEHAEEGGEDHHHGGTQVRTDAEGNFTVKLANAGIWYLRTIYLTHSEETGLTHESNWATLTFEVEDGDGHHHGDAAHSDTEGGHTHADGTHHDDHDHEDGIPSYVFWIGSIALLGGLFLWFNRKGEETV